MPTSIDRQELQRLVAAGAQLVEALPKKDYESEHLPGAISLPLRRLEAVARRVLDPSRPVIAYCWDAACDVGPRAAWRLEALGFTEVYDYPAGKLDWMAAGLPFEGTNAQRPKASDLARRDVEVCHGDESLADVRARAKDVCIVVNHRRIVMGILRRDELARTDVDRVDEAMRPGPSTFRPHVSIEELADYMTEHDLENAPITSSDGVLIGLLTREDALRADSRGRAPRRATATARSAE